MTRVLMFTTVLVACVCAFVSPTPTSAQDTGVSQTAETTEALRDRARVAADEGRLSDAAAILSRALTNDPEPALAFNLALVRRNQGQLLSARELFERLIAGEFGTLPPARAARASELITELDREIATLAITVQGTARGAPRAQIRVDGREVGTTVGATPLRVDVDPGERVVSATSGTRTVDQELIVAQGAQVEVTSNLARLELEHTDLEETTSSDPIFEDAPSTSSVQSPRRRRIAIVITALAVVAGGTVLAVLLARRDSLPAPPNHFIGSTEALR